MGFIHSVDVPACAFEKEVEAKKSLFSSAKAKIVVAGAVVVAGANSAFAAAVLTAPSLSTDDFVVVAGAVLATTGIMWGIKKGLGLIRV